MKLGIVFTGISYGYGRDYSHCFPDIYKFLIEPYSKVHDVKIYLMSYKSEEVDKIIDIYKPTLATFMDFNGSHQVLTYIKSMEQLRGQNLDFIIATRFDIHFHKLMNEIGINNHKFNVLFKEKGWWKWWSSMKFTTDNFFAFPYSMLEDFIAVLYQLYEHPPRDNCRDLHHAFYQMQKRVGGDHVQIISSFSELSHIPNFYYFLCRKK